MINDYFTFLCILYLLLNEMGEKKLHKSGKI